MVQLVLRENLVFLLMRPAENLEGSSGPRSPLFRNATGIVRGCPKSGTTL